MIYTCNKTNEVILKPLPALECSNASVICYEFYFLVIIVLNSKLSPYGLGDTFAWETVNTGKKNEGINLKVLCVARYGWLENTNTEG